MNNFRVVDVVQQRLVVEEVEHELDGGGQRAAAACRAEHRLEQIVDELLQRNLHKEYRK